MHSYQLAGRRVDKTSLARLSFLNAWQARIAGLYNYTQFCLTCQGNLIERLSEMDESTNLHCIMGPAALPEHYEEPYRI